jgi:hypothetical protein
MAVVQISRIQHRRGLQENFPQLASAELGWSVDKRRLFIGNGTVEEGAPTTGVTEILTEYSDVLSLGRNYTFKGLLAGFTVITGPDANNPIIRTLQDKLDDFVSVRDFGAKGDNITDDTAAIQRALDRPLGTAAAAAAPFTHRTIYFPAGNYVITDTIKLPPYTRIQGEGKATTTIIARNILRKATVYNTGNPVTSTYLTDTGAMIKVVDQFGQSGQNYGSSVNGVTPYSLEYHVSDIGFYQRATAYNQPVFQADGGTTIVLSNCLFQGDLIDLNDDGVGTDNYYTNRTVPGVDIGIGAVLLTGWSAYKPVRDVRIHDCEITRMNYGIQTVGEIRNLEITSSYFDQCYHHINLGVDTPQFRIDVAKVVRGVSIVGNYFRTSGAQSVIVSESAKNVTSTSNVFDGAGYGYKAGDGPLTPAIEFLSSGHYSVADVFDNTLATDYGFPDVETNGHDCVVIGSNRNGITNGLSTERGAVSVTLDDAASETTVGVPYFDYGISTNLTLNYTVIHNGEVRNGVLRVNNNSGVFTWDDEYNESGDVAFSLSANATTGDIEYTSDAVGDDAVMTYKINYLIVP